VVIYTHPGEIAYVFNIIFANNGHTASEAVPHRKKKLFPLFQSGFPTPDNFLHGTCSPIKTDKYIHSMPFTRIFNLPFESGMVSDKMN
jgi:hypothetical protein